MTCNRFRDCANYRLGCYECDHVGKDCRNFAEKLTALLRYTK